MRCTQCKHPLNSERNECKVNGQEVCKLCREMFMAVFNNKWLVDAHYEAVVAKQLKEVKVKHRPVQDNTEDEDGA